MFKQIYEKFKTINLWHLIWILVLVEIFTGIMNTLMGFLWWGHVDYDLIIIGVVDAFAVTMVIGPIIIYVFQLLQQSERKYRILIDNAGDAICLMDSEGNFMEVNKKAEEFSGYTKEELLNMNAFQVFSGKDRESVRTAFQTGFRKGYGALDDISLMRKDGGSISVDISGSVIEYAGRKVAQTIIRDITGRKKAEEKLQQYQQYLEKIVKERTGELSTVIRDLQNEIAERRTTEKALRESEERFREIFEQHIDALFLFNPETCTIIDANPAASSLYGCKREEFIGHDPLLFLEPYEYKNFKKMISNAVFEKRIQINQMVNRKMDGTRINVSVRGKIIKLKDKEVLYCSFRDMTEKIRLDEERRMLQTKLIQANKMSALGNLVSGVAHEINNPNNFIMFNTQLLSDAWPDILRILSEYHLKSGDFPLGGLPFAEMQEIIPKLLAGINDGSHRIKNIVDNLKDFARQERSGLNGQVEINKVITSSASILGGQIKKYTDNFQFYPAQDVPAIRGSVQQLEQVIINLIMNALQALSDKKCGVLISTAFDNEKGCVIIKVKDEGIGMTGEVLEHITEPFFTTKLDQGGTGLGLSISNTIIKDHKGSLSFESEPGRGTTATIILPEGQGNGHGA